MSRFVDCIWGHWKHKSLYVQTMIARLLMNIHVFVLFPSRTQSWTNLQKQVSFCEWSFNLKDIFTLVTRDISIEPQHFRPTAVNLKTIFK